MSIRTNINYAQLMNAAKTSFVCGKNLVFSIEKKTEQILSPPYDISESSPINQGEITKAKIVLPSASRSRE